MTAPVVTQDEDGTWRVEAVKPDGSTIVMKGWLNDTQARIAGLQVAGTMGALRSHRRGGGYYHGETR